MNAVTTNIVSIRRKRITLVFVVSSRAMLYYSSQFREPWLCLTQTRELVYSSSSQSRELY